MDCDFEKFFMHSNDLLCITDKEGKFLKVNPEWEQVLGLSISEIEGRSYLDFVHPEDQDKTADFAYSIANVKKVIEFTNRYRHVDGTYRWLQWRSVPEGDLIYATALDVTTKRQRTESLYLFMSSVEKSKEAVYWIDKSANFKYVNSFACNMVGYSKSELLNMSVFDLDPIFPKEQWDINWKEYLKNEENTADLIETIHKKKDGVLINVEVVNSYISVGDEEYLISHVRDITKRVNVEHELRKQNEEFLMLNKQYTSTNNELEKTLKHTKEINKELTLAKQQADEIGFFLKESQRIGNVGSYKMIFDEDCWVTTKTLDEIFGVDDSYTKNTKGWLDVIHPDDREMMASYFQNEVIGKHQSFDKEYRIVRQNDQQVRWIHGVGKLYFNNKGKLCTMLGIIQDFTERKKIENDILIAKQKSLESAKRYEGLFNNLAAGIIVHAPDASIAHCNQIACQLMGLSYEQMIGKVVIDPDWLFFDADNNILPFDKFPVNIIIKTKEPLIGYVAGVYRPYIKDKLWLTVNGFPILNDANEITEIIIILFDVTERKLVEEDRKQINVELERRVLERTEQLQQANKDLESFAYSVSHDLRAPIRHIDGFMHLLKKNMGSTNEKVEQYLGKILQSSKNMSVMIDELLQFSRLGRINLKNKKINLTNIVNDIIVRFKPDYSERNIQWNIKELPEVNGDPGLLKMVFENLISNAIKYTSKKEKAVIEIGQSTKYYHAGICIYVKDNGAGFDMAYKDKLFGVFQRLHKNEEFEGTGIGLANVSQIIKKHNGCVDAKGKVGEGATFYILLPKNNES